MTTNRSAEKKSGRTIQPLCFTPDTELQETICTMSFPEGIKNELVELNRCIYRDVNPKFQLRNTYMIRSAILNWMDAAVEVKNLKRDSDDSRWLVMIKHGEQSVDRELISRIIVTWLYDNYPRSLLEKCANGDAVMLTKLQEMRSRAISCAAPENFEILETVLKLFDKEGVPANGLTFTAYKLLVADRLLGCEMEINGKVRRLLQTGRDGEFITEPDFCRHGNTDNPYSYVIKISLQTIPPQRHALLIVTISTRRFIGRAFDSTAALKKVYLPNSINAHIRMKNDKFRLFGIHVKGEKGPNGKKIYTHKWDDLNSQLYQDLEDRALPEPLEVLIHPENYIKNDPGKMQILLPYMNGYSWCVPPAVGTGIAFADRSSIFLELTEKFKGLAEPVNKIPCCTPSRIAVKPCISSEKGWSKDEVSAFRSERLSRCLDSDTLTVELWGHDADKELLDDIEKTLRDYLGDEYVSINVERRDLAGLSDSLTGSGRESEDERIRLITESIRKAKRVVPCLVVLQDYRETETSDRDPKMGMRKGFMLTNRVTQFIKPDESAEERESTIHKKKKLRDTDENRKTRIKQSVMDILRQMGYTVPIESKNLKNTDFENTIAVGVYLFTNLKPEKTDYHKTYPEYLPVYVAMDIESGRIEVTCKALGDDMLSYPEALIRLGELSMQPDQFYDRTLTAVDKGIKVELAELISRYQASGKKVVVLAVGDKHVRNNFWPGISDTAIASYHFARSPYMPETIDLDRRTSDGKPKLGMELLGTPIRIIRIRPNGMNGEVPDFYTRHKSFSKNPETRENQKLKREKHQKGPIENEYSSASGIYRYQDIFYGITKRPKSTEYLNAESKNRSTAPGSSFDIMEMLELYPVQLQEGDDPAKWVDYVQGLRYMMAQYSRGTNLPAPLHLGRLMREYLFVK